MTGRTNAVPTAGMVKVPVQIRGYTKEGTFDMAIVYTDEAGRRHDHGYDFTVQIPIDTLFFLGPSDASLSPSLADIQGIEQTYDSFQDSESYYGRMWGYIIRNEAGDHWVDFNDH